MPRRWVRALVAIACVLAAMVGSVVGWVAWTGRQTATIPIPSDTADPMDVATAYVAALNAHDCDAARKLSTSDEADHTGVWCGDVRTLSVTSWGNLRMEAPQWSGRQAPQEVVFVPATIRVTWRPFHDDGSFSPSPTHSWGYQLVRENATSPWRVADQGPI